MRDTESNEIIGGTDDMADYKTENIRNITLIGHGSNGKTTLTEAMLYAAGHVDRQGKDPPAMASAMSWLKTQGALMMDPADHTIADLMTDGCDMGVKSLSKYLNKYGAADEKSKDCAKKLIAMEAHLAQSLRPFL